MSEVVNPASHLYELFNIYATWSQDGRVGAIDAHGVRRLLRELDLLEGVPGDKVDAYVHEHMTRADQDQDGLLGISDFMLWFLSEIAALLPFKRNGMGPQCCAPLYNRLLWYMLVDSGAGVRRKACGLLPGQLLRMCQDYGVISDAAAARNAVQVANSHAASSRVLGKMEGGTRLQLAQVVHALQALSGSMGVGLESTLYRIVGDGSVPPLLHTHSSNKAFLRHTLDQVSQAFIESELECPLRWTSYDCDSCRKTHSRWVISDVRAMKAYFQAAGSPYLPHFRIVNTRNIRAVFHRYNQHHNKGLPHPSSLLHNTPIMLLEDSVHGNGVGSSLESRNAQSQRVKWQDDVAADLRSTDAEQKAEQGQGTHITGKSSLRSSWPLVQCREAAGQQQQAAAAAGSLASCSGRSSTGVCCCQYRSMSLMEMQTFLKVCQDNRTISEAMRSAQGPLMSHQLEGAFMAACSIGGVYCKDTSCGIHDMPVSQEQAQQLRPSSGATRASAAGLRKPTFGTPFDASSTKASRAGGRSAALVPPRVYASCVSPGSGGPAWGAPPPWAGPQRSMSAGPSGRNAHRPPVPTLTFPQFLEALRLVAEELIGHPQVLVSVELALWSLLHDMVAVGCPLPTDHRPAWAADKPKEKFEQGSPLWHFHQASGVEPDWGY